MSEIAHYPALTELFSRFGQPAVLLDLEITGGHFLQDRITEIAFLRFDGASVRSYRQLVNPHLEISDFITRLTGIDNAMVADQPDFAALSASLLPQLQGALLVAHNSKFDYQFLCNEFARAGLPFAAQTLCTVQLSRRLNPQFHKHSLESIIERHNIRTSARHRALDDVLALADFLEHSLQQHGLETVEQQCRQLLQPRPFPSGLPADLSKQLHRLPDSDGVLAWLDQQGRAIHISSHRQTFREAAALLCQHRQLNETANLQFHSGAGPFDHLTIKAELCRRYAYQTPNRTGKHYFAVRLIEENTASGRFLRARIVELSDGIQPAASYGLFQHKKAAKQALRQWAEAYGLCQKILDILPYTLADNSPCPAAQIGKTCHCTTAEGKEKQYHDTRRFADRLPVNGRFPSILHIQEHNPLTGQTASHLCKNGLLQLDEHTFYFDEALPAMLKMQHQNLS